MDGVRIDVHDDELLTAIGAVGEMQTRRRIEEEKTAPDGTAWPANRAGSSILLDTGENLLASIAFVVGSGEVSWGSSWEFAHVHQDGAVIEPKNAKALAIPVPGGEFRLVRKAVVPPRPFVGLSDDNAAEMLDVITDALGLAAP